MSEYTYFYGLSQLFTHLFKKTRKTTSAFYVIKHVFIQLQRRAASTKSNNGHPRHAESKITFVKLFKQNTYIL